MKTMSQALLDVRALMAHRNLETHFQPITSIRRQSIVGMEALSRGRADSALIPPALLFAQAQEQGAVADLDSLCRNIALESFAPLGQSSENVMLFLNLHPASTGSPDEVAALVEVLEKVNLAPNRVVVELLEVAFETPNTALDMVRRLREAGFLVALDDMGVGHANLDRVAHIRPDILKADRSLVQGIEHDYIKREVFKSLVLLSERVGGWIIAEGVETSEQALAILDLGGDLMQGYYFARPARLEGEALPLVPALAQCGRDFKEHNLGRVLSKRRLYDSRLEILTSLLETLRRAPRHEFGRLLQQRRCEFPRVESACVLDENGVQICESVLFSPSRLSSRKMVIFGPPGPGTDHSYKEYFYLLSEARLNPFITQPYVPLPSEDLCITASTLLRDAEGKSCVLVVHFHTDPEELGQMEFIPETLSQKF